MGSATSKESRLAVWMLTAAGAGPVVGLVVGMLRWASHLAAELGIGLGAFLILTIIGIFLMVQHR